MDRQKLMIEKQMNKIRKESKMCCSLKKFYKFMNLIERIRTKGIEKSGRGLW